jgi:2-dehydro-3-deoxygluconokinase
LNTVNGKDDIVCIGESMVLVTPVNGQRLADARCAALTVAGAESTVALYLADLGHRARWLSRVGADPLGDHVLHEIGSGGVDIGLVVRDPQAPTGVYFKDPAPAATSVYYYRAGSAASRLSETDLERLNPATTAVVHLSGITPALSPTCRAMAERVFTVAGETGVLLSFDVNHRAALWQADDAGPVLLEFARRADIVFVGLDEANRIWGVRTPEEVREHVGTGRTLVVKDSEVGATAFADGARTFVAAESVEVVEPVGAGDAFAAGYLSGLFRGWDQPARLRLGHRVAALALRTMADHADASALGADVAIELEGGS